MKLVYANKKIEKQCTSVKEAVKLFGGNKTLVRALFSRVNSLAQAENLKDIIVQPPFHFHKLGNKDGKDLEGYFAIDVKTRKDPWRLIIQPLDENEQPFVPCNVDEISLIVRVVKILEVSKHYA